jgi:hypothetical protein
LIARFIPLDLSIGPPMVGLSQAVLDAAGLADLVEVVHAVAGSPAMAVLGANRAN